MNTESLTCISVIVYFTASCSFFMCYNFQDSVAVLAFCPIHFITAKNCTVFSDLVLTLDCSIWFVTILQHFDQSNMHSQCYSLLKCLRTAFPMCVLVNSCSISLSFGSNGQRSNHHHHFQTP